MQVEDSGEPEISPKADSNSDRQTPSTTSVVAVLSTLVTIVLSVGNYFVKQRVDETEAAMKARAQQLEESKERTARYDFVYKTLSGIEGTTDRQRTLAINIARLALNRQEQETLFNGLVFSRDRALAETGREGVAAVAQSPQQPAATGTAPNQHGKPVIASPANKFPIYVTSSMLIACQTRGGNDKCTEPGLRVTLGGTEYTRGVIFTQSFPNPAAASILVPKGARLFSATVGNYWLGSDCGGQRPMLMSIFVDGKKVWEATTAQISTVRIPLPQGATRLGLRGESGDGDTRCDDSVWAGAHFE